MAKIHSLSDEFWSFGGVIVVVGGNNFKWEMGNSNLCHSTTRTSLYQLEEKRRERERSFYENESEICFQTGNPNSSLKLYNLISFPICSIIKSNLEREISFLMDLTQEKRERSVFLPRLKSIDSIFLPSLMIVKLEWTLQLDQGLLLLLLVVPLIVVGSKTANRLFKQTTICVCRTHVLWFSSLCAVQFSKKEFG